MKLVILAACLFMLLPSTVEGQCAIDTPKQRAIWDRMKSDNHPGYRQIVQNTNIARYGDAGRWELVRGVIDRDKNLMRRSFEEIRESLKDFTLIYTGNNAHEHTLERAMAYGCLKPHLSAQEDAAFRGWLMAVAEKILNGVRFNDSDQVVGMYLGIAMIDKVAGTNYLTREIIDGSNGGGPKRPVGGLVATGANRSTMRNSIRYFTEVMAEGGHWVESGIHYDELTTQLLYMGANWLGIQNFPEVIPFMNTQARYLMHYLTPNLKDGFQDGDTEHPHQLRLNVHFVALLSFIAGYTTDQDIAAMVRQLQEDVFAANGAALDPIFARYYYTANPYAEKKPWREWAGKVHVAKGQGHVYWRTSVNADARATHVHCPNFVNGTVDHFTAFSFCNIRHFRNGMFVLDHPFAYIPDPFFGNSVFVGAKAGPGLEATNLVGSAFREGSFSFATGTTTGLSQLTGVNGYGQVPTFNHETSRYVFEALDGDDSVIAIIDRIHADDPKQLVIKAENGTSRGWEQFYPNTNQRNALNSMIRSKDILFHVPTYPEFSGDRRSFSWSSGSIRARIEQVFPETPLERTVVDEKAAHARKELTGYTNTNELKYAVHLTPAVQKSFEIFAHCLHAAERPISASCTALTRSGGEPVAGMRIAREGRPDVTFIVSAKEGPKIETSYGKNERGAAIIAFDPSKIQTVTTARQISDGFSVALENAGTVYVADLDPNKRWTATSGNIVVTLTRVGSLWTGEAPAGMLSIRATGSSSAGVSTPSAPSGLRITK